MFSTATDGEGKVAIVVSAGKLALPPPLHELAGRTSLAEDYRVLFRGNNIEADTKVHMVLRDNERD